MKRTLLAVVTLLGVVSAHAATQVAIGAAAESKMDQCTLAAQYASVAAQIHRTSNNYHAYVVGVDGIVQANRRFKNAWDIADQTGKYIFSGDRIEPNQAQELVYQECMKHSEKFRVQY